MLFIYETVESLVENVDGLQTILSEVLLNAATSLFFFLSALSRCQMFARSFD